MSRIKINFDLPYPAEQVGSEPLFTSKVYPIITEDDVQSGAQLMRLGLYPAIIESVQPAPVLVSLELRDTRQTTTMEPESVQSGGMTLLGIELKETMKSYTEDPEFVGSDALLLEINLKNALVSTTMQPESVQPAPQLMEIELL